MSALGVIARPAMPLTADSTATLRDGDAAPGWARQMPPGRRVTAAVLLGVIFLACAVPPILLGLNRGRGADDERTHYYRAVLQFSQQWPHWDFHEYRSATTPGFLLAAAGVHRYVSNDIRGVRLFGALLTAAFLATLGAALSNRVGTLAAVALCLPLTLSVYVVSSGIYLLPDNAGWWAASSCLLLALRPRASAMTVVAAAVLLTTVVFVRQVHVWVAGPLMVGVCMADPYDWRKRDWRMAPAALRALCAVAVLLPASLLLFYYYRLWGGLTPPQYRSFNQGINWAVPAAVLAVVGIASPFFLGVIPNRVREIVTARSGCTWIVGGALVGLLVGVVPETSMIWPARASGIWHLAGALPTLVNRSPVIILLSTWGGLQLALWSAMLQPHARWVFVTAWVTFICAHSVGANAWQRYYEPFALIMLPLSVSVTTPLAPLPARRFIGPVLLAGLCALVTLASLR